MPEVMFISADGAKTTTVDAPVGTSVMRCAQLNGVGGIYAECGGQLACATCHVYVGDEIAPLLPEVSSDEDEMLEATAAERLPNSRLACQVILTESMETVAVRLPEYQR